MRRTRILSKAVLLDPDPSHTAIWTTARMLQNGFHPKLGIKQQGKPVRRHNTRTHTHTLAKHSKNASPKYNGTITEEELQLLRDSTLAPPRSERKQPGKKESSRTGLPTPTRSNYLFISRKHERSARS